MVPGALSPRNFVRPTKILHPDPNICTSYLQSFVKANSVPSISLDSPPSSPPPPPHPSPSLLNSQIHVLNFRVLISQDFKKCLYLSPVFLFAFSFFFFLPLCLLSDFSLSIYNFLSWAIAPLSLNLHPICFLFFF